MAKLYIASCKKQDEFFQYRVKDAEGKINPQPMSQTIPKGGQVHIYRDADLETLKFIIEQHQKYGLIPVSEIDRTKSFENLCYQFDKPITQNQIMYGIEHNHDVLAERGTEMRKQSAVAIASKLDDAAQEATGRTTRKTAIELKEEKTDAGDNAPKLDQTVEVVKEGR